MSWFISLPTSVQHLLVAVATAVLTVVGREVVPGLQDSNPLVASLIGALVTVLLGAITPGVPYGVGKPRPRA